MTSSWEKTLTELSDKEAYFARMKTIAFLKQYRFENLTSEQMLKILAVIKEDNNVSENA